MLGNGGSGARAADTAGGDHRRWHAGKPPLHPATGWTATNESDAWCRREKSHGALHTDNCGKVVGVLRRQIAGWTVTRSVAVERSDVCRKCEGRSN